MESSQAVADAFARLLVAARHRAGVTQEELAHRSGLNRTTIGAAESAKGSPRLDTMIRLAGALGVETTALVPAVRWEPPPASAAPGGRFIA